jgi:DNA-binding transcriptional regulator YdaS (Cro superfamily)
MSTEALERACGKAGGQSSLAQKIGVRQSTLWHWLKRSKRGVPGEYVIPIEAATGVSRYELRPDIYPMPRKRRKAAPND